ncbi:hypothetical protein [Candidatus Endomicrobiellum trichonymphae]|nr:hypothetical protein [Candidatus Endomicrobium trichonymphae]
MKKVLTALVVSVFVLSFVSCKKVSKVIDDKAGATTGADAKAPTPPQA